jgi:hypothetical protein
MWGELIMNNKIIATLVAAALLMFDAGAAYAFNIGWNLIRIRNCLGVQSQGVDYLWVYRPLAGFS